MENASKALIIAGAILLSIIIISLGILVVNQGRSTINRANLDTEERQAFNNKITIYCGKKKDASTMTALVTAIASSNGAQKHNSGGGDEHYISVYVESDGEKNGIVGGETGTADSKGGTASVKLPSFHDGFRYKATYTVGDDGYIDMVYIESDGTGS